ncbi:hypothetical protein FGG08_003883 [Glutinoglossum americanum]|uniref:THOC5 family protein n=1 Tax=Glutinoglossum americanum TaxID=1670608 RepID=A0A9P8ICG0_9PEZI|nr:hypothetical protein FGG08_003883 [Glutinoglossum americanum]
MAVTDLVTDLVTDPSLHAALETSAHTREHCMSMLGRLFRDPPSSSSEDIQAELFKAQKILHAYLSQMRGLNRQAVLQVRETKQITAEARQEVDRLHLQLQNLYYEQRHLRGEIAACDAYDHKYQQLPLIPIEEFLSLYPEHSEADEHELMIVRINHEHVEREALEQERQGLLKKKQSLIADNKKRRDDLANLDKDLEKFIDVSLDLGI